MSRRLLVLVGVVVLAGLTLLDAPAPSDATYVVGTSHPTSTVAAAPDWTPPTVSLRDPGSPVKGTVSLAADVSDAETGIASVAIQYRDSAASTWTTICSTSTSPWGCSWATGSLPDGGYALRAVAADRAGHVTTSSVVQTTVANRFLIELSDPGDVVRGTVPVTAQLHNPGLVVYTVSIQYAVSGTTTWRNLCTNLLAPYTCSWSTTGKDFTQGQAYDLRAVATAGTSTTYSAVVSDVVVDNVGPTVTMQDPGTPLRGTVTLAASATDVDWGVSQVLVQHQRTGTSTWTTACTFTTTPYSCRYDTTQLADASYSFRAVASDVAGNTTTSATVSNRLVDNTVSAVSVEDPGAFLTGIVTLNATASSTAGVASVRIEHAPGGTASWTAACTDTSAPYSCTWDTRTVPDGLYDLRAVLVDGRNVTTVSAVVAGRRVDNAPLRGYDVQTTNGGTSAGRVDPGDVLRLTYTREVDLTTVTSAWNGSALPVTLRVRDGGLVGLGSTDDTVDVLRNGAAVNLGSVNLRNDFVRTGKTVTFNATMVASVASVNGRPATVVTLTLGTLAGGNGLRSVSTTSTMRWSPSSTAADPQGSAASAAPTTELGSLDRDF